MDNNDNDKLAKVREALAGCEVDGLPFADYMAESYYNNGYSLSNGIEAIDKLARAVVDALDTNNEEGAEQCK